MTPRLSLKSLTLDYLPHLVELDSDPEVMRFINGGVPSTPQEAEYIINRTQHSRYAAHLTLTDQFIGWFALTPTASGEYELGYRLLRKFWSLGFATEGALCLIDHAFLARDAQRVWAQTMTVNYASRAVMRACGLEYVRTFFQDWGSIIPGSEAGDVEYELRYEKWKQVRRVQ